LPAGFKIKKQVSPDIGGVYSVDLICNFLIYS
jgi:hypothetical protein